MDSGEAWRIRRHVEGIIEVHRPDTWFDLQSLLDSAVEKVPEIHAVALHVDAPGIDMVWDGAAGLADPSVGTEMTPQHPVRIASNTKSFVAAAALRLVEEGRLSLDDPISEYLPEDFVELLRGDGYSPEEMTVRHLLTHTSGLFDHSDSEKYTAAITADPMHRWTRAEQLRAAVEWGDRLGAPGEIYSYCDTGYVLLGEIVEQAAARPLAIAVRELVGFEQLDLRTTWWETLEQRPADVLDRAHQFLGDLDVTDFDPSFDLYGGGGLVSTMPDLARFFRGIFTGAVFADPGTADTMLTTIDGVHPRPYADATALPVGSYRLGVWVEEVEGFTVYRHGGFWGTTAVYVPDLDLTIAGTVNQNSGKEVLEEIVRRVIGLVGVRTGADPA
jgi:D-alanyl-D-alanine carboxypeptidase